MSRYFGPVSGLTWDRGIGRDIVVRDQPGVWERVWWIVEDVESCRCAGGSSSLARSAETVPG